MTARPFRPAAAALAALTLLAAGCGREGRLETRTFTLAHLSPTAAEEVVAPYITADAGRASASAEARTLTIRETPAALDRIAGILRDRDRPHPIVLLHFQIIEADGAAPTDPAIADVEAELRKLFRFEGYRLAAEGAVRALRGSSIRQILAGGGRRYTIEGDVANIRSTPGGAGVDLAIRLMPEGFAPVLETFVGVETGRTAVLGTARPDPDRGALILVVRPSVEGGAAPEE